MFAAASKNISPSIFSLSPFLFYISPSLFSFFLFLIIIVIIQFSLCSRIHSLYIGLFLFFSLWFLFFPPIHLNKFPIIPVFFFNRFLIHPELEIPSDYISIWWVLMFPLFLLFLLLFCCFWVFLFIAFLLNFLFVLFNHMNSFHPDCFSSFLIIECCLIILFQHFLGIINIIQIVQSMDCLLSTIHVWLFFLVSCLIIYCMWLIWECILSLNFTRSFHILCHEWVILANYT